MKNRKIRFLSAPDLEKSLSMTEAIGAMREAFLQLSNGQAIVPLRTPMALTDRDGGALFMPVYLPESKQIGLKAASVFPENPRKGLPVIHAEIGEVAAGASEGRASEEQITLFKSVGNAVQDLAAASRALGRAEQLGLGIEVSL